MIFYLGGLYWRRDPTGSWFPDIRHRKTRRTMHTLSGTMNVEECPWWPALTAHYDRPDLRPCLSEWSAFLDEASDCRDGSAGSGMDWSEEESEEESSDTEDTI